MPCINLKGEMAKNGITIEAIAKLLGIHRNSAANKINSFLCFCIYFCLLFIHYVIHSAYSNGGYDYGNWK